MASDLERVPPQNLEAEQSLLGSLLLDKDAVIKIADRVTPDDFYSDNHRAIYEAMMDLYRRHEPIDLLSLSNLLGERGHIDRIGGRAYLVHLSNVVPTASHVVHYATIVAKKATLRRLLQAASDISALGYGEAEDVEVTLDTAEQKLFNVSQKFLKVAFTPIKDVLADAFDRIDELHRDQGKMRGTSTTFTDLDRMLGGLQKSDLVILAARPSCGKTSLALDIARHAAKAKLPVGIFSLEMSKEQLVDRMISAEANVNLWNLRNGRLSTEGSNDDFTRIGHALGVLSEAPIFIDDTATLNIMEIRTKARRLQMEHGLGLLIVDYLQLMESRTSDPNNRVQEVAQITRGLKSISRELNIPVLALSQLSRQVEMSKPAIPKLAHLRESGSIEQDADVVMFIYRKAADKNYRIDDLSPDERHIAEIHIAKHRNGPTGMVKLFFDENRASFRNLSKQEMPAIPAARQAPALGVPPARPATPSGISPGLSPGQALPQTPF
ncbi:MAG TPA: replicative DNA helicase [Candidatus Methylomirabilis sp.]|nr:replicative DNA helicase [Candidatus Methylomirabilis sp.]